MVRLISPIEAAGARARRGAGWDLVPSALWDLDFRGPLEWIEAQGCHDADEFKALVRNDPERPHGVPRSNSDPPSERWRRVSRGSGERRGVHSPVRGATHRGVEG